IEDLICIVMLVANPENVIGNCRIKKVGTRWHIERKNHAEIWIDAKLFIGGKHHIPHCLLAQRARHATKRPGLSRENDQILYQESTAFRACAIGPESLTQKEEARVQEPRLPQKADLHCVICLTLSSHLQNLAAPISRG